MHISVSAQTTLQSSSNFFGFALYDASAPSVLLENIIPPKPYGNPIQVSFTHNCLNGHLYIIKLWESADGSPTGVVRNSLSQTVTGSSVNVRMPEYLEVDITTGLVSGATSYTDSSLDGWDYTLYRNGTLQEPDSTGNTNPVWHKETDGFSLVDTADRFEPNEKFTLVFEPQIIPVDNGVPSEIFSTGRIITADETLTSSDTSQALLLQGASSQLVIGLPALSTVGDFKFFYFYSDGGSHINAVINAAGSDKFFHPTNKSQLILGQCEVLKIFKAFGKWYVENDTPGINNVGELLYSYYNAGLNVLECKGQVVNRADYPRLWAFVQSLGAGSVVTDSAWTSTFVTKDGINYYTNKGCFSSGDGSTTFRLPLLTLMSLKGIDGTVRTAGSLETEQGILHQHEQTTGTISPTIFGQGQVRNRANYLGTFANGKTDLVSVPVSSAGTTLSRFGTKNLIDNVGAYALIRI